MVLEHAMERKRTTSASHKSDAIKKQVIDFLMQGYSVQKAMDAVGRSVKTYEYYRKTDEQFATAIDKIRSIQQEERSALHEGKYHPSQSFHPSTLG